METLKCHQHSLRRLSAATLAISVLALTAACGQSTSTSPSSTAPGTNGTSGKTGQPGSKSSLVLGPPYARSVGFPQTLQAAKSEAVKSQPGCTESIEAIYEDAKAKTGLLSDVLVCANSGAAAKALASARKGSVSDPVVTPPAGLGPSAFSVDVAPQHLVVWQTGSKVAVTTFDTDLSASPGASGIPAITAPQAQVLMAAASTQNGLYT